MISRRQNQKLGLFPPWSNMQGSPQSQYCIPHPSISNSWGYQKNSHCPPSPKALSNRQGRLKSTLPYKRLSDKDQAAWLPLQMKHTHTCMLRTTNLECHSDNPSLVHATQTERCLQGQAALNWPVSFSERTAFADSAQKTSGRTPCSGMQSA